MVARLLRRILWVIPSALGVALLTFYLLGFVPAERLAESSPHARYEPLPVFFNRAPTDIRDATAEAARTVLAAPDGSELSRAAAATLASLGGAALPYLLPALDAHAPDDRTRLVLALAPVARRMGLEDAQQAESAETALRFWSRFWEASDVEFKPASARSVVRRWVNYGDASREREVIRLDTFALEALFEALPSRVGKDNEERVRRLINAIAHVTARGDRIAPDMTTEMAAACVGRWQRFWIQERTRYTRLQGSYRVSAFVLESRFGKWAEETLAAGPLRRDEPRRFILGGLTTAALLVGAWLTAAGLGIAGGIVSALHARRVWAPTTTAFASLLVAASPLGLATLVAQLSLAKPPWSWTMATVSLAGVMIAKTLFLVRARVETSLCSETALAALARGSSRARMAWTFGLRDASPVVSAEMFLDAPFSLTATFVVERMFALDGLGEASLRSIARGEVGAPMALAAAGTVLGGVSLVLGDLALALATPQTRGALLRLGKST